jgi:hypothetical protein
MISVSSTDPNKASILSSIARFATLPETRGMYDWLKAELDRLDAANRGEMDQAVFRQQQGACQVLGDIFKIAETASEAVDKIRANQRKP